MAFFHLYMKYTQPLFIQALMGLKNLYDAKPVAIHILGKPAEGDLKRPFKAASMFGGTWIFLRTCHVTQWTIVLSAAAGPQTDAASITEAEKKIGAKKED